MTETEQVTQAQRTDRIELEIGGMTCAACATRIEKKLNRLDGAFAIVNYATERAVITGLPADRAPDTVQAVRQAGYTADVIPAAGSTDERYESSRPDRVGMLRRRLAVAAILTLPLGNLTIALALVPSLRFPYWEWLCVLLAIPVVFWCAWPFHRATIRNLVHRSFSMDTLVSLGVMSAFGWSIVSLITGAPDDRGYWLGYGITPAGADSIYLEVAAAVTTFLLTGRYFEARARRSATDVLGALNRLAAQRVRVVRDGVEHEVDVTELRAGDEFAVRPGDTIAADGMIIDGSSSIDGSMMTGEPMPVEATADDTVLGGTVNLTGRLLVRATKVGEQTQLAQMAVLAEQAQARKARVQRLVDRVVTVFVPAVLIIAVLTLAGWLISGAGVREAASAAISVLIIACPCALGLATPTALMVGVGRAGQLGIVIKGPDALEASGEIDTVVLDKTGTLTEGSVTVRSTQLIGTLPEAEVIQLAAAAERHSEHPVGRAIAELSTRIDGADAPAEISDFAAEPGLGARAVVDGRSVLIGNAKLFQRYEIAVPASAGEALAAAEAEGQTGVLVAADNTVLAVLGLADAIRDSAAEAVAELRRLGLTTVLLTGDNERAANAVGTEIGADAVIADVLPTQKAAAIESLQAGGAKVAMVGDGINDATALATADLGLAVINGTDIALRSADLILVRRHLGVIADAIELSRRTLRTIRGNLIWAFGYNIAAIPLAAAGWLNPLIAGVAMSLSSVFVVSNSLRLRSFRSRSRS